MDVDYRPILRESNILLYVILGILIIIGVKVFFFKLILLYGQQKNNQLFKR